METSDLFLSLFEFLPLCFEFGKHFIEAKESMKNLFCRIAVFQKKKEMHMKSC
jgi:hypothetical protein